MQPQCWTQTLRTAGGGGGDLPDSEVRGVQSPEKIFQFGLRIAGEQVPWAPPLDLDPPLNLPV